MQKKISKTVMPILFGGIILIIFAMVYFYQLNKKGSEKKESFTTLTPGIIPTSETTPLLNQPVLDNPGISTLGSSQLWKFYPVYPAPSTQSNNIRYWKTPNNGKCTPPEMCGGIYSQGSDLTIPPPPTTPDINAKGRVNFYESHEPYEPYSDC
jgi:hypothetical protein